MIYPVCGKPKTIGFIADDTSPMMNVYYMGPHRFATVNLSTATVTLKADDTDGATTTDVTVVTSTTYTTLGLFCDRINALGNALGWYAYLVGALRADLCYTGAAIAYIDPAAANAKRTIVPFYDDSSADQGGVQIWPFGLTDEGIGRNMSGKQIHVDWLSVAVAGTLSGNTINVYVCDDKAKTDSLIYSVAGGATTVAVAKGMEDWGDAPLSAPVGNRVVIRAAQTHATNVLAATGLYATYRIDVVQPAGQINYPCEA